MALPYWDIFGVWIAAAITVWLYSFAFKDNVLYKFSEHLFLGVAAGYSFTLGLDAISRTGITPIVTQGRVEYIVPIIFGLLFFGKYLGRYAWIARYGSMFVLGVGLSIAVRTAPEAFILKQVAASILPLYIPGDPIMSITHILMVLIIIGGILYFVFTFIPGGTEQRPTTTYKVYDILVKFGIYGMMVGFGALFARTVMTRVAFFIGRLRFLMGPEAIGATVVAVILVAIAIGYAYMQERKGGAQAAGAQTATSSS